MQLVVLVERAVLDLSIRRSRVGGVRGGPLLFGDARAALFLLPPVPDKTQPQSPPADHSVQQLYASICLTNYREAELRRKFQVTSAC